MLVVIEHKSFIFFIFFFEHKSFKHLFSFMFGYVVSGVNGKSPAVKRRHLRS